MKQKENRTDTVTQIETFLYYMWNIALMFSKPLIIFFSADLKTMSLTKLQLSWYRLRK